MRADLYREMYELESSYWWHVGKRHLVLSLLRRYHVKNAQLVDVGCGTGLLMTELKQFGKVSGVDTEPEALKFCRMRGHRSVFRIAAGGRLPFANSSVGAVTMLDVLEHVADEGRALRELHRILKPPGLLVLSVPAFQSLYSYWDRVAGHHRRYTKAQLRSILERNGFAVEKMTYSNSLLFAAAVAFRAAKAAALRNRELKDMPSDFVQLPRIINGMLSQLYRLENGLNIRLGMPLGMSLVCLARKR